MKRQTLLFLPLLLALLWPMPARAESEPNDTINTADPIGIGLNNAEVGATLTADDEDYYSFTAVAGRTYVIETFNIQGTAGTRATGIWLYNSSGSEVVNDQYGNNGTGNANARLTYTFNTGGTYYIRVKDAQFESWTGTYSLRILPKYDEPGAAWDANNDDEPNDVQPLANLIERSWINAQTHELFPHNNFVTSDSDNDWYRFTTAANRTYVIETFNIQGSSGTTATGIWLYNSDGSAIANDRYGSNGTGVADARLVHTFVNAGTYYIRVRHSLYGAWTGTYSLRVLPKYGEPGSSWNADNDYEPNDVPELAIALRVDRPQTHQLAPNDSYVTNDSDHDYYRIKIDTPGTYVMETFGIDANSQATGLWLYNESGSELTNDRYGDSNTGQAQIEYEFLTAGTYILLVKDAYAPYSEDWTGTYSVRLCEDSCALSVFLPLVLK